MRGNILLYLHTEFHVPSFSDPLVITFRLKDSLADNFHKAGKLASIQKEGLNKGYTSSDRPVSCRVQFQGPILSCVTVLLPVSVAAHMLGRPPWC
jgi:hypothetical protein